MASTLPSQLSDVWDLFTKPNLANLEDALDDNEKFSEFSNAFVPIRSLLTRSFQNMGQSKGGSVD